MAEYLEGLSPVLMVLLGWLLGLLTPVIAERIRRPYRRRDLMQGVVDEMLGLQHTLVAVAYKIRTRNAELSDDFLDKILPILDAHTGPDRSQEIIEFVKEIRRCPEGQRVATHQLMRKPDRVVGLRQYAAPLFATQMSDVAICSLDFQRAVLNIRRHLDLYNQLAALAESLFSRSFDNRGPEERDVLRANVERNCRDAATQAEMVVDAILDLKIRYSRGK